MRWFSALVLLLLPLMAHAEFNLPEAHGFHWYSVDEAAGDSVRTKQKPAMPSIEPYDELQKERRKTQNKLAESLLRPSVESTKAYMMAQQKIAKRDQAFVRNWQKALRLYPELDHSLNFPTNNKSIAARNDNTSQLTQKIINENAKNYGLIVFYRGHSALSSRFFDVLMPFVHANHFSMVSVVTDNAPIRGLPNPKLMTMSDVKASFHLRSRYLPAVFLVDLKTKVLSPLSYGFVALEDIKARFLDVATDFKRFSYEGLGEIG